MANKNLELALKIKADLTQARREVDQLAVALEETTAAATGVDRASQGAARGYTAVSTAGQRATTTTRGYNAATAAATGATRQYDTALESASASTQQLNSTTQNLGGGLNSIAASVRAVSLTIAAGFGLREIVQSADAWTAYENRLRLVTTSQAALTQSSADVYAIARSTSQQLDSTAAVYQRFAQNAERLNITQQQTAQLTRTVSQAIAISGGSTASAEAATIQFGQALASGVLRGEEFNSVMEQAPGLAMALAEGLSVDIGKLREMANDGQLTADVLVNALGAAAASVNDQFETRVKTIAQAATEFDTAFTRIIGTLSSGSGVGQQIAAVISGLADMLDAMSNNLDIVEAALETALILTAGRVVAALANMTTEGLKQILVQKAATTAAAEKAVADESAAVAAKTAAVADLERSRAAVTAAEANVAATAAEARRTAGMAASSTGLTAKAALDAKAAAATAAHTAAEARLTVALEARAVASEAVAVTTVAVTQATAAAATAMTAASVATSLLTRAIMGLTVIGDRVLAMLGGPLGIVVAIGLAATAFLDFGNDAESGMEKAAVASEQASVRIRNATREMIQSLDIGDIGAASFDQLSGGIAQLEQQLQKARETRDYIQQLNDSDVPLWDASLPTLDQANEKVRSLESAVAKLRAEQNGSRFDSVRNGQEYLDSLEQQGERLQNLSEREKALRYLREQSIDTSSELGRQILARVDANEKLKAANDEAAESDRQARQAADDALRTAEQRAQQQLSFVQQLERQADLQGKSTAEVREYTIAERGLSGELLVRARAAAAALQAQEDLNAAMRDARDMDRIRIQLLEASGDTLGARSAQLQQQFGELLDRLNARGDTAGAALVNNLIDLDLARTRLAQLQSVIDDAMGANSRAEESINIQQDAGVITEMEARERILELHRQTYAVLQQQRPLIEEMAQQPGAIGESARVMLEQLDNQAAQLQSTLTLLGTTLKDGLESGFSSAIKGLADGTMTLRDAAVELISSIGDAMIDMLARVMAQQAFSGLSTMFGGTSFGALFGFSTGGHVQGPGTATSDSIPARLSNNEFVTRAAVVTQPGALPFLEDFNSRGMVALDDWAGRVRHATGGLAGIPAPQMVNPTLNSGSITQPSAVGSTVQNAVNLYAIQDPADVANMAWGKQGQANFMVYLSRNRQTIRQELEL